LKGKNPEESERWHKKVNVREIVFGFNDRSIRLWHLLQGLLAGTGRNVSSVISGEVPINFLSSLFSCKARAFVVICLITGCALSPETDVDRFM